MCAETIAQLSLWMGLFISVFDNMSHASLQTGHAVFGLHQRFGSAEKTDRLPLEMVVTLAIAAAYWWKGAK